MVGIVVGSYSPAAEAGIHVLGCSLEDGQFTVLSETRGIENPSFLTVDQSGRWLVAVSETPDRGQIASYRLQSHSYRLTEASRQESRGGLPCYVAMDASENWVLGANYLTGSLFVFPWSGDGVLGNMADFVELRGSGAHWRQEGSHPHGIFQMPGSDYWIVPDLGADLLRVFRLTPSGQLKSEDALATTAMAGPRNLVFHPSLPVFYVVNELASTVSVWGYDSGRVWPLGQEVSLLPSDYMGESTAAHVHVTLDGRFLYGSNRGHDSLAIFRVASDGTLLFLSHRGTGKTPRQFHASKRSPYLIVAHQDDNSLQVLTYNQDGEIEEVGSPFSVPHPSCIQEFSNALS